MYTISKDKEDGHLDCNTTLPFKLHKIHCSTNLIFSSNLRSIIIKVIKTRKNRILVIEQCLKKTNLVHAVNTSSVIQYSFC